MERKLDRMSAVSHSGDGRLSPWRALLLLTAWLWGGGGPAQGQVIIPPPTDFGPTREANSPPWLQALPPGPHGWGRVRGDFYDSNAPPQVLTLQSSADLIAWRETAVLLHAPFEYVDTAASGQGARFYRLMLAPRTSTNDWANQLIFPGDPLFNASPCSASQPLAWAKFALVLGQTPRVYFQDNRAHLLHYDFATRRLAPFIGLTPEQFNAVALRTNNQQVVLGTILCPQPTPASPFTVWAAWGREYAVQFAGEDLYPPEQVSGWFERVKAAVAAPAETLVFYLPTFEQSEHTRRHEAYFAARGIPLATLDRWSGQQTTVYATGWAVGRLVFVPAMEIDAAYADGRLRPDDILLTDGVPAEVPFVAGLLSLAPATPSSHVAILAQNYGVPFLYLADPAERQRVRTLAGRDVAVRTGDNRVLALDGALDATQRAQLAALKTPSFQLTRKERHGAYVADGAGLTPADLRFFGGKAAHLGLLRRVIPEFSPDALAFSFDLWDDFLDQTLPGGQSLRAAIQTRLGGFHHRPDVAAVRASLAAVRDLITRAARFSPAQQQAILSSLAGFEPLRKTRFRSSTNLEDTESFTGAGLYDSYSGCLADDLDGEDYGPCRCDATEPKERGVFRAIQKVYASFYNDNAFLERLRLGVDEAHAGMGLLVHGSTPDETELANGVATLTAQLTPMGWSVRGSLVTQPGAASVTNPDDNATPETVEFHRWLNLTNVALKQSSALLPWGAYAMTWPDDYQQLAGLVATVAAGYGLEDTNKTLFELALEYKKLVPGRLYVKQMRELPRPDAAEQRPVFLLSEPTEWLVAPGRGFLVVGDPMPGGSGLLAMHRLKSKWQLATANLLLHPTNLAASLYRTGWVEFADGPHQRVLTGPPPAWPESAFATNASSDPSRIITLDRWAAGEGVDRREFTLFTELTATVPAGQSQWRTLGDASLALSVNYAAPVPMLQPAGLFLIPWLPEGPCFTTNESVVLFRAPEPLTNLFAFRADPSPSDWRTLITSPVSIATTLSWIACSAPPTFSMDPCNPLSYTTSSYYAYVGGAGESRVEGLLSQALVLRSYASQTLWVHGRTGHQHVEELILDPWLEPDLADSVKAELTAANIRLLHYHSYCFGACDQTVTVLGLDNTVRTLTNP